MQQVCCHARNLQFELVSVPIAVQQPTQSPLLLVRNGDRPCVALLHAQTLWAHGAAATACRDTHSARATPCKSPCCTRSLAQSRHVTAGRREKGPVVVSLLLRRLLPLPWQHQPAGDQAVFLRQTAGKDGCATHQQRRRRQHLLYPSCAHQSMPACTAVVSALPHHHSHHPAAAAAPDTPPHRPPLPLPPHHQVARLVSL